MHLSAEPSCWPYKDFPRISNLLSIAWTLDTHGLHLYISHQFFLSSTVSDEGVACFSIFASFSSISCLLETGLHSSFRLSWNSQRSPGWLQLVAILLPQPEC